MQRHRIAKGFYVDNELTPVIVAQAIAEKYPTAVFTGRTAAQIYAQQPLTFPLDVATPRLMAKSDYYVAHRTTVLNAHDYLGHRVHTPVLATRVMEKPEAHALLEKVYAGRTGRDRLERHLSYVGTLPKKCRVFLKTAALFTDSGAEIKVAHALKARGLEVESNVQIGPYFWDLVLPKERIAIEINGFDFHKDRQAVVRDHWKNNDAVLRGWTTLRYTGSCVAHHLDEIVEQVSTARTPNWNAWAHKLASTWHVVFRGFDGPIRDF